MTTSVRLVHAAAGVASLALMALAYVAGSPSPAVVVVVLVLTVGALWRPDWPGGLALLTIQTLHWLAVVPAPDDAGSWLLLLLAATLVLVVHTALALAAALPPAAVVPSGLARRWLARSGAVLGVVAVMWGVAALSSLGSAPGNAALTVAALLSVSGVGLTIYRLASAHATDPRH